MAVSPSDVADNLGRPLTSAETAQANRWIVAARVLIAARLGDLNALDQDLLDLVVVEAVTLRLRNPDAATQRDVSIDDGSVSTRWERATGQLTILDEWWEWLTPTVESGAFTIAPSYTPDRRCDW